MASNEKKEQLSREIDRLTEENRTYVLSISQALSFAQETMNRPKDTVACCKRQKERGP
jgi:hypothetical protein